MNGRRVVIAALICLFVLPPLVWLMHPFLISGTFVRIRSSADLRVLRTIRISDGFVNALCVSPDDHTLVFSNYDALRAVDVSSGRVVWSLSAGTDTPVSACIVTPDGKRLLVADRGGVIRIRMMSDGGLERTLTTGAGGGRASFSSNAEFCALLSGTGVEVWNVRSGKMVCRVVFASADYVALDRAGKLLACTGGGVWRVGDGRLLRRFGRGDDSCVAFSPDSRLLAYATSTNGIDVVKAAGGKPVRALTDLCVSGLAFSPKGRQVLIAGYRGYLWDLGSGRRRDISDPYVVNAAAYSPSGRLIVTGENFHPH